MAHTIVLAGSGQTADLLTSWNSLFSTVNSVFPNLTTLLSLAAVAYLVWDFGKWLVAKRKSSGGGGQFNLTWTFWLAVVFTIPGVVGPALAWFFDVLINFVGKIITQYAH